jgi:hypothetical protein
LLLSSYVEGAISRLKEFAGKYGADGQKEINAICYNKQLNLLYDDTKKYSYCGPAVKDGQLCILFSAGQLGTNVSYGIEDRPLNQALNEAPPPPSANGAAPVLSYSTRSDIAMRYDPEIGGLQKKIAEMLKDSEIKLNPNFEANFAKLKESEKSSGLRADWETCFGDFTLKYFDALRYTLDWKKFGEDDMLQEGFAEAVDKHEIVVRVVDSLESGYNRCKVEGGILYLEVSVLPRSAEISTHRC